MSKVLHITECFAGGVSQAIQRIVNLTPQHEHHLLWTGDEMPLAGTNYSTVRRLPDSQLARFWTVQQYIRTRQYDFVHAHSSWAGVYSRLVPTRARIVYQPHCFAFTDPGRTIVGRYSYKIAEWVLARNTEMLVAVSEAEFEECRKLSSNVDLVMLPNVASVTPEGPVDRAFPTRADPIVVTSGRICSQKDPGYFLDFAADLRRLLPQVRFQWIGDGDLDKRRELESAGVTVTGWLDRDALSQSLQEATLYFHSAAFEGFPISVLDAAAFRLPIVVRSIPAFRNVSLFSSGSAHDCATVVRQILSDTLYWQEAIEKSLQLNAIMNGTVQERMLGRVYSGEKSR